MRRLFVSACVLFPCVIAMLQLPALSQPTVVGERVEFTYRAADARSVALVGDFNGWSKDEEPMAKDTSGVWRISRKLWPGVFQYKFVINGSVYANDPLNPATIENFNRSGRNSVFVLTDHREILLSAERPMSQSNPDDEYPRRPDRKPVYLNIIWHQHQPLYVNPETDQLSGPWVRTHATKDYYDMAALLTRYPDIHCSINLTSSLLVQLGEYYVKRLRPFVDIARNSIETEGFLKAWGGKTDPWIDIALKPTSTFTRADRDLLYRNAWNAFGISEVMLERFPEYQRLQKKLLPGRSLPDDLFSEQEQREIKFWFYLAHCDPDFLMGPVVLEDGSVCDLSDLVKQREDGAFVLRRRITETDCHRMVVEAYKVMANVIPIHKRLQYLPERHTGQVEIITTPYFHPILPLIYDSDLAKVCQPNDSLPPRFSYPEDARAHVVKAVSMFAEMFGRRPDGMWPGEGSVAQPVLEIFRENGMSWLASDVKVLKRSDPPDQPNTTPYQFPAGGKPIALVFRDTELSDRIGFKYQNYEGEEAAEDFVRSILASAPALGEPDAMITVILDGENAWEWYRKDIDGKRFLNALYRKLSRLHSNGQVVTTTTMEYILGNPLRGIPPHPVEQLPAMKRLWPGSWINANYDTWIGEAEENRAWEILLETRRDLAASGLKAPAPDSPPPPAGTREWSAFKAWEAMYAAEGSDWFWWYGSDQTAPGSDRPFDVAFRTHLKNVYTFAMAAGADMEQKTFQPILRAEEGPQQPAGEGTGAMARSTALPRKVLFTCDARGVSGVRTISVAGNLKELGHWKPNTVRMYDDGTHGDVTPGDGIWSLALELPADTEVQYKYTNSGTPGVWDPGEEFPGRNRVFRVPAGTGSMVVISDTFGK